jgi:Rrf2 family protein
MRISTRGKYALYSMVLLALENENSRIIRLSKLAEKLGASKPYLEQIFAMLKKAGLVNAARGSGGGYSLALPPEKIKMTSVLRATEPSLFESPVTPENSHSDPIEEAVAGALFDKMDDAIVDATSVSLKEVCEVAKEKRGGEPMFYL